MLYFIVNPLSGKGKGRHIADKIKSVLENKNIKYSMFFTEKAKHAIELARSLSKKEDCKGVIAVGGDGTFNEVLTGMDTSVPLGVISSGSGNDFMRTFMPDSTFENQIDAVINGNTEYVDYIKVNENKRSLNAMGTGFDIDILIRERKLHKYFGGSVGYFLSLIITIFTIKFRNMKLKIGNKIIDEKALLLTVANGKYFGGGLPVSLDSKINDGLLNVLVIKKMPAVKIPYMLIKFLKGKIGEVKKYVDIYKCENLECEIVPDFNIQLDGEIFDISKFKLNVVHNELKMFI